MKGKSYMRAQNRGNSVFAKMMTIVALMLTFIVTGAWAQQTYTVTFSADYSQTISDATLPYNKTISCTDLNRWAESFSSVNVEKGDGKVSASIDGGSMTITVSGAFSGEAEVWCPIIDDGRDQILYVVKVTCVANAPAEPTATQFAVTLKEDTEDATSWQGKAGEGKYQSLPLTGLEAGTTVTLKYSGERDVKSVKAVKKAAPVAAMPTLTLGSMPNGGDPFSGSIGSGAYSQTFAVGGQIAIIYKNTSNESVKVVTDALTAADISNEGKTATINVSIDDADKTQGVTYIYPAAMANDDGTINCDFKNQDGTVTAIYSGSGAWDGDALSSATMESQQNIVKFTLQDNGGNALSASSLTVSAASKKLVASKGFIIKSTTHSGYTYDGGTASSSGDAPSNLVDGKKNYPSQYTKWCTNTSDKVNGIWYCEFHTASAVQVNGYTITTGHDNSTWNNRNPKDWVLKAKADAGDSWTTIATVTNDATLKDENCKSFDFNVDVPGIYQYFRFEVSATRGADVMQIEELELFKCNYGTAYGDLTVTPASATSEIFVALRNENASADTYTVSANVGGKKYAFSKSGVTFQNGKYYEITVKMTEQTASTVEWIFSEMSGHPDLDRGYTYKDVTLSGNGELNFDHGNLYAMGDLTFTAPSGKHFKKIVITATGMADIRGTGWTNGREPGNSTSTWTGDASSVSFSGMTDGATSIVFTLE